MRDAYTNWRTASDGDLDGTETTGPINLGQAPIGGHPVVVHIPEQAADADTLDITWTESATSGGSYREFQKTRPQASFRPAPSAWETRMTTPVSRPMPITSMAMWGENEMAR